jgi:hypothetical protein
MGCEVGILQEDGRESKSVSVVHDVVRQRAECLRGGTFDCQLPSPEGSEYEHSLIK